MVLAASGRVSRNEKSGAEEATVVKWTINFSSNGPSRGGRNWVEKGAIVLRVTKGDFGYE